MPSRIRPPSKAGPAGAEQAPVVGMELAVGSLDRDLAPGEPLQDPDLGALHVHQEQVQAADPELPQDEGPSADSPGGDA